MDKYIKTSELYKKIAKAYNDGCLSWGANEIFKDIIGECASVDNKKMEEGKLNRIREFIVNYIMRDSYVMFSDDAREVGPHHIDLIYVIASLYEELHKEVTGEPYEYMFHWANKVGSWVDDDLFSEEKYIEFLEELQNEHIND